MPEDYKFIKASQKVQGYAMASEGSEALLDKVFQAHGSKSGDSIKVSDSLTLKRVPRHKVPQEVHASLNSKWFNSANLQVIDRKRRRLRR